MSNQVESPTNLSVVPKKKSHRRISLEYRRQDRPSENEIKSNFSFRGALSTFLEKPSLSSGVFLGILALGTWLLVGCILGKLSPEYMVTVQQFEISPDVTNRTSLSGKNASDIVVDILNDTATHAAQFHGTEYYRYDETGTQLVAVHQAIKIPVQTSYGIELKGVSVDSLIQLYNRRRYQQWVIGGDVLSTPDGLVGRIRFNRGDTAQHWETPPSTHASPSELVRDATYMMLTSVSPELLGQAYLQQGKYEDGARVFRQWEVDAPVSWKPTYYLSLTYGYQNKEQEANNLAVWSRRIAAHKTGKTLPRSHQVVYSEEAISSDLARTTEVVLESKDRSDLPSSSFVERRNRLILLQRAESKLANLSKANPENVDYRIQRAKILDKEALLESDLNPTSLKAKEWLEEALENIEESINRVPENGGLHEQRAIFLRDLVSIMKKRDAKSPEIRLREKEEVDEYIRALELRPSESSPMWGAVYAQVDLGNNEDAVDLARTVTLLQPDSKDAITAYIMALELAIKVPEQEPEREREIEVRLKQLLQSNPNKAQLQTVWYAAEKNNHRDALDLVSAELRRRFPTDSSTE